MEFKFHNRLNIKLKNKTLTYYNQVLPSLYNELSNFSKYNSYLSFGNGTANTESLNEYHLSNLVATIPLENYSMQSDITKGALFAIYNFKLNPKQENYTTITEIGLSDNSENPTIYNYFSLISDENSNGLDISQEDEILIEISIFLNLSEGDSYILTAGNNPFIEFLLGNGIGNVYLCSGSNFSENVRISREVPNNKSLFICNKSATFHDNYLQLDFSLNQEIGELDEVLFITNNKVFARINTKEINSPIEKQNTFSPKANYVIKIEEDIKAITSITKTSDNSTENNYFVSKYANCFGDKINNPFNNLFNYSNSRFLSKDSEMIFFISNNIVYGYKNNNYLIEEINTKAINNDYITNIISFNNFIFVISQVEPFISTYILENNVVKKANNNFESFDNYSTFENIIQSDATSCNNNTIMIGLIMEDKTALTLYINYETENGFSIKNHLINTKEFNYLLAMFRNNFCDGRIMYLKANEQSVLCRLVTHFSDETETDVYTSLAYALSNNATKIYCKGRAIISEKNSDPNLVIYYYPQIYQYELPLISSELKYYLSNDLNYIIQKSTNNNYKIYNLVGYDEPEEFVDGFKDIIESYSIEDFEFMKDTLLIFTNNNQEPIICYNLKLNKTQIENVSSKDDEYRIDSLVYNKLGGNNKNINFNFSTRINLWFFQKKFTK